MPPSGYRFGVFEVDLRTRELRKHGLRIRLRAKSFQILVCLLEHPNEVVTREQLRRLLWPEGVFVGFDDSLNTAVYRLRHALGEGAHGRRYIETLPGHGYRFLAPVEPLRNAGSRLAVLPFENLSHKPDGDFLGDAMADALTTELGKIRSLRVISRQSVLHCKGSPKTAPDIARELNVDLLIEGSVLRLENRLRITAQLIQVAPEQHLWANAYPCEMGDILAILAEVARAVAEAVQIALSPGELTRLNRPRPLHPDAQVAYLKGLHHLGRWTGESLSTALRYFQSAVEQDPAHALAVAGMADCYAHLGWWGILPFPESFRKAKAAAADALRLDSSLSTAHWAFGWSCLCHDWDWDTFQRESLHAITLNPSDEDAHVCLALYLAAATDDRDGVLREISHCLDLNPLSQRSNAFAAWAFLWIDDFPRAVEQARKALELFPDSLQATYALGLAQLCQGRHSKAIAALEKAVALSNAPFSIAYLGCALAKAGRTGAARSTLDNLLQRSQREPIPPRCFVFLHAALDTDRHLAFEWFERAYQVRDPGLLMIRVMPLFDPLHSDPRYQSRLHQLGIPRPV